MCLGNLKQAERVRASMAERAKSGKRTCNEVLGYDKLGKDSFVINQAEAERIRFIFDTYEIEKNYTEVARQCADHSFRGKRGRVFKAEHIKQILTRPIYVGYNTYQGKAYLGNHEPIIDESQWCRVQNIIKSK